MSPYLVLVESNTTGSGRAFAQRAVALGLRPILLTADPSRYDYLEPDNVATVRADTRDLTALREICLGLNDRGGLAGVCTSSEYYIDVAAELTAALGLPGPESQAVRACRDKGSQRRLLHATGVPVPRFEVVGSAGELADVLDRSSYPVVLKPLEGSGSSGVLLCASRTRAERHGRLLLGVEHNERGLPVPKGLLVEEYVAAPEYSCEVLDGRVAGVTRKHLGPLPHFVETGHDHPAELPEAAEHAIREVTLAALAALGLGSGTAHVELRLTGDGPVLIEVNPRLAGGMITELVELATGIDLVAAQVAWAAGRAVSLAPSRRRWASLRFLLPDRDGVVRQVAGERAAREAAGVAQVVMNARPGDRVFLRGDFRDRVGHVRAWGDTPQDARERAEHARSLIRIELR